MRRNIALVIAQRSAVSALVVLLTVAVSYHPFVSEHAPGAPYALGFLAGLALAGLIGDVFNAIDHNGRLDCRDAVRRHAGRRRTAVEDATDPLIRTAG